MPGNWEWLSLNPLRWPDTQRDWAETARPWVWRESRTTQRAVSCKGTRYNRSVVVTAEVLVDNTLVL